MGTGLRPRRPDANSLWRWNLPELGRSALGGKRFALLRAGMLKITIHPSAGELRLRLEGRLAGPWVHELRQCWQTAAATNERRATVLDLREVDFVDPAGQALLAQMHNEGVRLEASCPFVQHMLEQIAGAPECATVEETPPGRSDAFISPDPSRRDPRTV